VCGLVHCKTDSTLLLKLLLRVSITNHYLYEHCRTKKSARTATLFVYTAWCSILGQQTSLRHRRADSYVKCCVLQNWCTYSNQSPMRGRLPPVRDPSAGDTPAEEIGLVLLLMPGLLLLLLLLDAPAVLAQLLLPEGQEC
jgi:hypothetical protein